MSVKSWHLVWDYLLGERVIQESVCTLLTGVRLLKGWVSNSGECLHFVDRYTQRQQITMWVKCQVKVMKDTGIPLITWHRLNLILFFQYHDYIRIFIILWVMILAGYDLYLNCGMDSRMVFIENLIYSFLCYLLYVVAGNRTLDMSGTCLWYWNPAVP